MKAVPAQGWDGGGSRSAWISRALISPISCLNSFGTPEQDLWGVADGAMSGKVESCIGAWLGWRA